ncbi:MAG: hypothetical protein Tsb002_12550 [Wenzhouxiangellaceae bacterium]
MTTQTMAATPASTNGKDDEIQRLMARQEYAWPTIGLFVIIVLAATSATIAALTGAISIWWGFAINTICSYIAYSVLHEASHGLVSTHRRLNDFVGRIALFMVSVTPFFRTYRFLHMTHHRFTNDPIKDPDYFAGHGSAWTLPIRWMVMDTAYVTTYFRPGFYSDRPRGEKIDFWLSIAFGIALIAVVVAMGWVVPFLLLYFIPTRIALFVLAITFDYLPHYPYSETAQSNKFRATNNRVGMEWLITPLLLGHNYHLSHHLNPTVPFYRYVKLWNASKHLYADKHPATVDYNRLRPRAVPTANESD